MVTDRDGRRSVSPPTDVTDRNGGPARTAGRDDGTASWRRPDNRGRYRPLPGPLQCDAVDAIVFGYSDANGSAMQIDNKLFDDLAKIAAGAVGTAIGVRDEVEAQLRQQVERMLSRMEVVTRDEFEAVQEMAARARAEQDSTAEKLALLERRLAEIEAAGEPPAKRSTRSRREPAAGDDG